MATTTNPCSLVGPVPFKDVDDDTIPVSPPKEYDDIVAALPCNHKLRDMRYYQGAGYPSHLVKGIIAIQRHFVPRPGDVVLVSAPKCGTTWLKALAFATMTRGAYPLAEHPLLRLNPHDCIPFLEHMFADGQEAKLDALPSPRLLSTHMPYSLLPASVSNNPDCKIVYICREPKDMVVSLWHFIRPVRPNLSFLDLFELFCEGMTLGGPIWDHILGYWRASKEDPKKVLFLRYEEMLQDPVHNSKKLAQFLMQPFSNTEEEAGVVTAIVKLCSFEKLKSLEVNKTGSYGTHMKFSHESFFRKGVVGDWVHHMTPEMAQRLDAIFLNKFHGSGFTFK